MYQFQDNQRDSLDAMRLSMQRLMACTKSRLETEKTRNILLKKELLSLKSLKQSKSQDKSQLSVWKQTPEEEFSQIKQLSISKQASTEFGIDAANIEKGISALIMKKKNEQVIMQMEDRAKMKRNEQDSNLKAQLLAKGYPVIHKQIKSKPILAVKPTPQKSPWINNDKIPLRFRNI